MTPARKIQSLLQTRREEYVEALRQMVNVDCGSFSPEGVNRIADICEARFIAGGWEVERRPNVPPPGAQQLGDMVIGRIGGPGGPRILLAGHMDTVFPADTVAERPFRREGERAFGPGASDMKAGLLAGFFAVEALREVGEGGFGSITYACNPDEEIGSPFSGPIIRDLARQSDVGLVLEPARENGTIVSSRKGVTDALIEISGRAAHAGAEPERGRSAIEEAAHKILALQSLNGRWAGVTVNVGVVEGGTRPNVVPERCAIQVDLRAPDRRSQTEAEAEILRIAETHAVPDVTATVRSRSWHGPMERTEISAALVDLAGELGRELGFAVQDTATGGASDGNTMAAEGIPVLDGLGPIGGGWHGRDEWVDLDSVAPRTALLAGLIARCGDVLPSA